MEERRLWQTRRRPCRLFAEREEKKRERSEKCSVSNPWNEYRLVFVHFTVRSTRHFVPVRFSEHEEGGGWGWFRRRLLSIKIATRYDEFVEEKEREREIRLYFMVICAREYGYGSWYFEGFSFSLCKVFRLFHFRFSMYSSYILYNLMLFAFENTFRLKILKLSFKRRLNFFQQLVGNLFFI